MILAVERVRLETLSGGGIQSREALQPLIFHVRARCPTVRTSTNLSAKAASYFEYEIDPDGLLRTSRPGHGIQKIQSIISDFEPRLGTVKRESDSTKTRWMTGRSRPSYRRV